MSTKLLRVYGTNSIGLILLVFGGMLFLWGVIGTEKVGQTMGTAQSSVGRALKGILGIALLWKGSKIKETPKFS